MREKLLINHSGYWLEYILLRVYSIYICRLDKVTAHATQVQEFPLKYHIERIFKTYICMCALKPAIADRGSMSQRIGDGDRQTRVGLDLLTTQ